MTYKFVIWSFEHDTWWAANEQGYVRELENAGRYNASDAGRIVVNSVWLDEIAIVESIAVERGAPQHHPYRGKINDIQI